MLKILSRIGAMLALVYGVMTVPTNAASAATIVYVANADSKELSVMSMNRQTGAMQVVQTVALTGTVMPLAISPDRRFLYASLRSVPYSVSSFNIDQTSGKLSLISTVPLPDNMANIATDRTGHYLLSASYTGNKIAVNPIARNGAVIEAPSQVVATKPNAHAIKTDPSNRYVFATNLGGDIVMQDKFDVETGTLTPNVPAFVETPAKAGPRHFVFDPSGKFVYLLCELDGSIHVYGFNPTNGTLSHLQAATSLPPGFSGKPWAADIHLTPDGRFLYASERTTSTIAQFSIEPSSGLLKAIGSVATEAQPRGFAIDPRGRFLVCVGQVSDGMTVYTIDQASGALSEVQRYAMGKNPNWVEIIDLP